MNKQQRKEATVKAVLKLGHKNSDNEHPVKIRVTFNREQRFYPVRINGKPLYLSVEDFDKLTAINPETKKPIQVRKELREKRDEIENVRSAAVTARNALSQFSFERFQREFLHNESKDGILALFDRYLANLLGESRIGTYKAYKNAREAFKSFRGGKELAPMDLTPAILKDFEAYMLKPRIVPKRKKPLKAGRNTVGMYMRALKVIFNEAASTNTQLRENYPFATKQNDRGKYKIRTTPGKKADALTVEQIQNLITTKPIEGTPEWQAKNIWLFSFYAQGMNLRDIFLLKYKNVAFDAIRYIRNKTKHTETSTEEMTVPLSEPLREIILSLGNADKSPDAFVFPILTPGLDAKKEDDAIRQGIKTCNKWLKQLCANNSLEEITSYSARHSYANLLKQTGESVELIRELLGHSDIRTTESYLKRFDLDKKRTVNEKVVKLFKAS